MNTTTPWTTLGGEDFAKFIYTYSVFETPNTKGWNFMNSNQYYNWDGKCLTSGLSMEHRFYPVEELYFLTDFPKTWCIVGSKRFQEFLNEHNEIDKDGFTGNKDAVVYYFDGKKISINKRVDKDFTLIGIDYLFKFYRTVKQPLKYRVIKQWPAGPIVGTELPVKVTPHGTYIDYETSLLVPDKHKEFIAPLYRKAPEFNGFTMETEMTKMTDDKGVLTWSQVRAKFGCVRIDVGHLADALGALTHGIHVDKGKFSVKGIVIDTPSNGTNLTVPIELIQEIIDYAKEQHPDLV